MALPLTFHHPHSNPSTTHTQTLSHTQFKMQILGLLPRSTGQSSSTHLHTTLLNVSLTCSFKTSARVAQPYMSSKGFNTSSHLPRPLTPSWCHPRLQIHNLPCIILFFLLCSTDLDGLHQLQLHNTEKAEKRLLWYVYIIKKRRRRRRGECDARGCGLSLHPWHSCYPWRPFLRSQHGLRPPYTSGDTSHRYVYRVCANTLVGVQ